VTTVLIDINKVYCGNCIDVIKLFPNDIIDLTVTSPPYDNLRTYKGYEFDFDGVAKELYRVTKPGGVVVWVVGDATINGSETGNSFRQALKFIDIGFHLHDTMIYEKHNPLPLQHNRYQPCFEYMFVLSKNKPKTFTPLKEKTKFTQGGGGKRLANGEMVGFNSPRGNEMKYRKNIWEYAVGAISGSDKLSFKHPASFPEQLAADHILSWSNEGELVLDPMCGSGTTLKMAKKLNRNYIGIDISQEYCEIANQRLEIIEK
jgi:site-specific DNA-methyltransferase (adenine-specific)